MKRIAFLVVALLSLAGCMEVEQNTTASKAGKYQGKPDTTPWSNEPLAMGPKWTKGDRASWEEQIRNRQQRQNEDRRINQ